MIESSIQYDSRQRTIIQRKEIEEDLAHKMKQIFAFAVSCNWFISVK
jgi:hypothetical protein